MNRSVHTNNIKGFALEFARVRPVWIGPEAHLGKYEAISSHFNSQGLFALETNQQIGDQIFVVQSSPGSTQSANKLCEIASHL